MVRFQIREIAAPLTTLLLLCGGCHTTSKSTSPSPQPGPTVDHGPPSHAPAHGYRRKFSYVHYPSCDVYFDRERELWFWIEGEHWRMGVELPSRFRIETDEGVTVELDTDTPYAGVREAPGKGNGKGKGRKS